MPDNNPMELSHDFLSAAKKTGQVRLVEAILVAVGQAILAGQMVCIKKGGTARDLYLTDFQEYSDWLLRDHLDVLEN
jgi:hypothetical protein